MDLTTVVREEFEERATRGRPRKEPTLVLNFRIPISVYDAYIRYALRHRLPVRSIVRHIVTLHRPTE